MSIAEEIDQLQGTAQFHDLFLIPIVFQEILKVGISIEIPFFGQPIVCL